jgi:erythronate-4-phosphate dehydrogenase
MRIVIDRNIPGVDKTFAQHCDIERVDGRSLNRQQLIDADALITRSITRVDAGLLQDTPVRFVGTATIGTDHLDTSWLEQQGITWASAPGCNSDAAAQYTLAMIWLACEQLERNPPDQRVGIIGKGNVGSRLQKLLAALGISCVANDPLLADRGMRGLVSLDEALSQDIVCLHVPLTRHGPHPTFRMIGPERLAQMHDSALLVNTARGDVLDGAALLRQLRNGRLHAALDVWPGEPQIDPELVRATTVATPHVAGYSDDGKLNGTQMVYQAFCAWQDEPAIASIDDDSEVLELDLHAAKSPISSALKAACFVQKQDSAMHRLTDSAANERAMMFDRLRREYPSRRDFRAWRLHGIDVDAASTLRKLGFSVLPWGQGKNFS